MSLPAPLKLVILTENQDTGPSARLIQRLSKIQGVEVVALVIEQYRAPFRQRFRRAYKNDGILGAADYFASKCYDKASAVALRVGGAISRLVLPISVPSQDAPVSCPVEYVGSHNASSTAELIRDKYSADLGIVYGTRILKKSTFQATRLGMLNIHKRKLPEYRGGGPIGLWELLDDQDSITVSIHWVAEKVDQGDIVAEQVIPIQPLDTTRSLGLKADFVGERLFCDAVEQITDGSATRTPQSELSTIEPKTFRAPSSLALRRLRKRAESGRRERVSLFARVYRFVSVVRWLGFLVLSGVALRFNRRRNSGNAPVVVLYYHLVSGRRHPMAITAERLHNQLRFLKRFFQFVDLDTAVNAIRSGSNASPLAVLTFDDGYRENTFDTRAVCEDLQVPACHFVCSDLMGTEKPFGHDGEAGSGFVPFSIAEVKELALDPLCQIASHTATHFDCGSTQDADVLQREIVGSKAKLEAMIQRPVTQFSFPWGMPANINEAAVDAVVDANYQAAFSACGGVNYPESERSSLLLKRLPTLYGDSWNDLLCLLGECLGYSSWVPWHVEPSVPTREIQELA